MYIFYKIYEYIGPYFLSHVVSKNFASELPKVGVRSSYLSRRKRGEDLLSCYSTYSPWVHSCHRPSWRKLTMCVWKVLSPQDAGLPCVTCATNKVPCKRAPIACTMVKVFPIFGLCSRLLLVIKSIVYAISANLLGYMWPTIISSFTIESLYAPLNFRINGNHSHASQT
jgi:hypothetical protein